MRNWILQSIEPQVRAQFDGRLRTVDLRRAEILQRQGEPIERVYFPEGALIGLVSAMPAGDAVQTATVGWDGALGVFEACGSRLTAFLAQVEVAGSAWCMAADDYRRLFEASPALRIQVHKYVEILLTESRQYVACNALHTVEGRLCRSLLEALERSGDRDALPTTQDALAQALGVQRTTVTAAIAQLQAAGALKTGRAVIQVLDRDLLEQAACCCRETLQSARSEIYRSKEEVCDT
jgi:CRP-like cAMP-binding protein